MAMRRQKPRLESSTEEYAQLALQQKIQKGTENLPGNTAKETGRDKRRSQFSIPVLCRGDSHSSLLAIPPPPWQTLTLSHKMPEHILKMLEHRFCDLEV